MGLLDSNKVAMQTKTITITEKAVEVTGSYGYITSGLLDVRGYNNAVINVSATAEQRIISLGNSIQATPSKLSNIYSNYKNAFIDTIDFNNEKCFVVDISSLAYWGLGALDSGTYSVTIQLSNKSIDSGYYKALKKSIDLLGESIIQDEIIDITNVTLDSSGYLTPNGFIDVGGYSTAIIYLETPTVASGVTANIVSWLNNKAAQDGHVIDTTHTYRVNTGDTISRVESLSDAGMYLVDISHVSKWALRSTTAGTFNATITLSKKIPTPTILANYMDERDIRYVGENPVDLSTTGNAFELTNIGRKYKTLAIEVEFADGATPVDLFVSKRTSNNTTYEYKSILRNSVGELSFNIKTNGVYFVDITDVDRLIIRNGVSGSGVCTMRVSLLKAEMPYDYKPIQNVYVKENTLSSSSTYTSATLTAYDCDVLREFKFIRIETKYTGTGTPSGKITCATDSGAAYKEVGEINAAYDATDWFLNLIGKGFRVRFNFDFTPSDNSTMEIRIWGMR